MSHLCIFIPENNSWSGTGTSCYLKIAYCRAMQTESNEKLVQIVNMAGCGKFLEIHKTPICKCFIMHNIQMTSAFQLLFNVYYL